MDMFKRLATPSTGRLSTDKMPWNSTDRVDHKRRNMSLHCYPNKRLPLDAMKRRWSSRLAKLPNIVKYAIAPYKKPIIPPTTVSRGSIVPRSHRSRTPPNLYNFSSEYTSYICLYFRQVLTGVYRSVPQQTTNPHRTVYMRKLRHDNQPLPRRPKENICYPLPPPQLHDSSDE